MGMKNIIIIIILVVLLGAIFFFTRQYLSDNPGGFFGQNNTATIGDQKISLIVADTQEEREQGLSGKESLGENEGMLFSFDRPGYYGFWMRDMQFPIDIVFLDGEEVVTVYENVPVPSEGEALSVYKPEAPADRVLELNANKVSELEIQKGDTISLSL